MYIGKYHVGQMWYFLLLLKKRSEKTKNKEEK